MTYRVPPHDSGLHWRMSGDEKPALEQQDVLMDDWTDIDLDSEEVPMPDLKFLNKMMAVEAMHEARQLIDPDDFDIYD